MFGLFASQESKMRRNAANWLEVADRVWAYRRDVLPANEAAELIRRRDELRQSLRARADAGKLKMQIESLEEVLRRAGGQVYPKTALVENVEFLLVAAIVILGIRTYFLQPFKIPTNSMWPTYYGMVADNLPPDKPAPGPVERAWRLATVGAFRHQATAPATGEVSALFRLTDYGPPSLMAFTKKRGRTWIVFPTDVREYTFFVDGAPATVQVPADFGMGRAEHAGGFEDLVIQTYFGSWEKFDARWNELAQAHKLRWHPYVVDAATGEMSRAVEMPLGRTVRQGDPVLRFDILTGDQLFVDRFTFHFFPPTPGQGFVFRTDNIPAINKQDYYIKRLIGTPGDTISIHPPEVYRNGQPMLASAAMVKNSHREFPYTGYTNPPEAPFLPPGGTLTVPERKYFAMGDNSSNSSDGRYWGFVPADDVIGRPLFLYYPFTKRWGLAK